MFSSLLFTLLFVALAFAERGVLDMDEVSFDKLIGGQFGVLVAFVEYSWKLPENFNDVADAFADNKNLLIGKIDTSNVPEERTALKPTTLPTIRWYPKGSTEGVDFSGDAEDAAEVTAFVHAQLSPELTQLKSLAAKFAGAAADAQSKLLADAHALVEKLSESAQRTGKTYVAMMKRVQERGATFVNNEKDRLARLIDSSSVSKDKIKDFKTRLAALRDFGDL